MRKIDPSVLTLFGDLPEDSLVHSRMHLTQDMVKALLPALQHFVKTGELPASPPEEVPDGR